MKRFLCCLGGASSSKVVQEPLEQPDPSEPSEPSDPSESTDSSETIDGDNNDLTSGDFQWGEIVDGTENFLITRFLGRGNFGEVYRCDFPRIDKVGATKIHNHDNNPIGHPEFVAEVTTLHAANHPNVIKLLGKCYAFKNSAIVYEFLPNGSLDRHLYGPAMPSPGLRKETLVLDWDTRMRIAVGVAEALVYIHTGIKVIHRDVKVENILLDDDLVPKLSDFGLAAKIVKNEDGSERQREMKPMEETRSRGYVAPETEELGLVTSKSDIYSYGVFLFVLFTGRKAYDLRRPLAARKITDWLKSVWSREESMLLVVDAALGNKYSVQGLNKLVVTAKMCIDAQALSRPDMNVVESMIREAAAYPLQEDPPVPQRRSL